jgi:hypothetical protein
MVPLAPSGPNIAPPELRSGTPSLSAPAPATMSAPATSPAPFVVGPETLNYTSVGNPLGSPLGAMQLSGSFAAFEEYKGHMTLEYAGVLPAFSGYRIASDFLSGALVYRVTNAEQYFQDNPTICGGRPLKFIVVKVTSLEDIEEGPAASVNLWLLSLDDYKDFRPTMSDPCGGDTYTTPRAKHS